MTPRVKFDLSLLPERPDLQFESELWKQGLTFIAGLDEAGRGALAGPVAAGAVILPAGELDLPEHLRGVNDSKQMTHRDRQVWAQVIKNRGVGWAVGFASPNEIDRFGIAPATRLAMTRALDGLRCQVDYLLVDYLSLPEVNIPQKALVKGDARSLSIAAASILAKTARDILMIELDEAFPGYQLANNKGYATEGHRKAIEALGPCQHHRQTFSPVAEYYSLFPPKSKRDLE